MYESTWKNNLIILALSAALFSLLFVASRATKDLTAEAAAPPELSRDSGFYDEEFYLEIFSNEGAEIHYTLDGSDPTKESSLYTGPLLIADRSNEPNLYADNPEISVDYYPYSRRKGYVLPTGPVDKCTIIKAAAFYENGEQSDIAAASYFIGYGNRPQYSGYDCISIICEPDDLFGYERGIYVIGKLGHDHFREILYKRNDTREYLEAHPDTPTDGSVSVSGIGMFEGFTYNYSQGGLEWERSAFATFFDLWHMPILSRKMGLRIRGNNSRNFPQKSFSLFIREPSASGAYYFPYLSKSKKGSVALSSGADDPYTNVRDKLSSRLFSTLHFGNLEFSSPLFLFLNGEFWGTYLMSEKPDEHFIETHYNVDKDNIIIIKNGLPEAGNLTEGSPLYDDFRRFIMERDLAEPENYRELVELVDMESFLDYFAARLYVDNGNDWPKTNVAIWRSVQVTERPYEDGKWRFINYDNNSEYQYASVETDTLENILHQGKREVDNMQRSLENGEFDRGNRYELFLFYKLMQNKAFREAFYKRFKEIADTIYNPNTAIPILDEIAGEMRSPVVAGYQRWFGDRCSYQDFDNKIEEIRKFFLERREVILPIVEKACNAP